MAVEPRPRTHDAPRPGGPGTVRGMLAVEQLEQEIDAGRIQGEFFLEEVAAHCVEGCNYLLALDSACSPTS